MLTEGSYITCYWAACTVAKYVLFVPTQHVIPYNNVELHIVMSLITDLLKKKRILQNTTANLLVLFLIFCILCSDQFRLKSMLSLLNI